MIPKYELIEASKKLNIPISTIEKDYVIGLLLSGISSHPDLQDSWVFKGGTCLKKCYFTSYRMSEDLDFTLIQNASLDLQVLKEQLNAVFHDCYVKYALEIATDAVEYDIFPDKKGQFVQVKVPFRGPVSQRGSLPKIKFDLTLSELLVDTPITKPIFHEYSDRSECNAQIICYSFVEIFAEKLRALVERTRPRDLYDVIHLYDVKNDFGIDMIKFQDVILKKFSYKNIAIPNSIEELPLRNMEDLQFSWDHMLAHQISPLPLYETFLSRLNEVFNWIQVKD